MSRYFTSNYQNPNPYIPASLSELYDLLGSMILWAPTFDKDGDDPEYDIETEFYSLTEGFGKVRGKLGEEPYAQVMDFAAKAKALFAEDPNDENGKTDQGRDLLFEIEDIIQAARRRRKAAKLKDHEGEVTGD